jgi:hypothetical protein
LYELERMFPSRFVHLAEARARFGDRVDRLGEHLSRVDELADAVVESIQAMPPGRGWTLFDQATRHGIASVSDAPDSFRALFGDVEHVPAWVDWETLDRGGAVLLRAGLLGGMVLSLRSLILGYTSPGGNKPLVLSGKLTEKAPRRLLETARFVQATIRPGGMRPHADGYCITLKVRLMHAKLRRMILDAGNWDANAWGAPLNSHDHAGTSMLFSVTLLDGLRIVGMNIPQGDGEAYMQLWRYSGHLMGISPEIQPTTEAEARRLQDLIAATQSEPDDDSRRLTRALLEATARPGRTGAAPSRGDGDSGFSGFSVGMCRALIGDEVADQLAVPRTAWRFSIPVLRRVVSAAERIRTSVPFADGPALRVGTQYWDRVVDVGLAGKEAKFGLPRRLGNAA